MRSSSSNITQIISFGLFHIHTLFLPPSFLCSLLLSGFDVVNFFSLRSSPRAMKQTVAAIFLDPRDVSVLGALFSIRSGSLFASACFSFVSVLGSVGGGGFTPPSASISRCTVLHENLASNVADLFRLLPCKVALFKELSHRHASEDLGFTTRRTTVKRKTKDAPALRPGTNTPSKGGDCE